MRCGFCGTIDGDLISAYHNGIRLPMCYDCATNPPKRLPKDVQKYIAFVKGLFDFALLRIVGCQNGTCIDREDSIENIAWCWRVPLCGSQSLNHYGFHARRYHYFEASNG
jgi:hypothetical protein